MVALQIAALTVQSALTSNVRAANGGDISVVSDAAPLSRSDLRIFGRLQRQGRIAAWTAVSTLHATAVSTHHQLVPFDVQVVSSPPYPLGGDPTFVSPSNGHLSALLQSHGDVLVTTVLANELGVNVGGRLLVNSIGGSGLHATVRGMLAQTSLSHAAVMTVEQRDASVLTNQPPHYSAIYLNASGSLDALAATLRTDFPSATVQTVSQALQADQAQVHDFRQFLLLVGLFALLIAGIGTLNAMQSILARRRLEIAMLKAMGFGQGTLYALFGGEAVAVGLGGGVLGTAVGALASKVITDTLARALALQVAFVLDVGTLAAGVALGIGAALVFALLPIVRATAFRPLELLREGGGGVTLWQWPQTFGLLLLVMVLFSVVAAVTLNDVTLAVQLVVVAFILSGVLTGLFSLTVKWLGLLGRPRSRLAATVILAALVIVSVVTAVKVPAIAAITILATIIWALTIYLPEARQLPLVIAVRSLSRRRARTSVTLVAFLAGVLAMSLTLTVAVSLRDQINQALASAGTTNLVAIGDVSSRAAVLRSSRSLPGVRSRTLLSIVQTNPVAIDGRHLPVLSNPVSAGGENEAADQRGRLLGGITGYDLRHGSQPAQISMVLGRQLAPSDAGTDHVLLRSTLLDAPYSLALGDRVTVRESGTGSQKTVTVVGFYTRSRRLRGFGSFFTPPIYGDQSLVSALGGADTQSVATFSIDPKNLTFDATTLQRQAPGALVIDIGDLAAIVDQILSELLDILAVITALVLGAGLAVVANGVALAMMERRREIALYKAIGFSPDRVLQFVLVENALIGTLAGATSVLGVAVGLALLSHFALQQAVGFDPGVAVLVLAVATALAVGIAYLTARAPTRVRPLEALRNE